MLRIFIDNLRLKVYIPHMTNEQDPGLTRDLEDNLSFVRNDKRDRWTEAKYIQSIGDNGEDPEDKGAPLLVKLAYELWELQAGRELGEEIDRTDSNQFS